MGDEDLSGFESPPTLSERKDRIKEDEMKNFVETKSVDGVQTTFQLSLDDKKIADARKTKQRTEHWHNLRSGSRITGSTLLLALGLQTLKQQAHLDKVYRGKEIEDGCEKIPLGDSDSFAIISGDGTGVNSESRPEVAFEFKCPKPGKQRTTNIHYSIPIYYKELPELVVHILYPQTAHRTFLVDMMRIYGQRSGTSVKSVMKYSEFLPDEITNELDIESLEILRQAGKDVAARSISAKSKDDIGQVVSEEAVTTNHESILIALIASASEDQHSRWEEYTLEEFISTLNNAEKIAKSYTDFLKPQLVNLVSKLYGDRLKVKEATKEPKKLKILVEKHIKAWTAEAVNVAYAQLHVKESFEEWDRGNTFNGSWRIVTESGRIFDIHRWYAQPVTIAGPMFQPVMTITFSQITVRGVAQKVS
ncbi:unnamed protein product [Mytilus coruscus]|uniref:YqaJ viral recombinase domain-containing protein n=1 Tax=Mytilus coruscus TaxID=42192 RepID=A0A6J8ETX2_MYTCO|nr:unnamed protein product [Mytilus coruscus]